MSSSPNDDNTDLKSEVNETCHSHQTIEPAEETESCSSPKVTEEESSQSQSESGSSDTDDSSSSNGEGMPIDLSFDWFEEQMRAGVNLQPFLASIIPGLPADISQSTVYEILMDLFLPFRRRKALADYQTFDHAVDLIHKSKNILVLTGAGISVSCGIPDFRSRNGIYARLREEFPELPNPQSMFDIRYFTEDPRPFFRFAKEIWPGQYEPSLSHHFIAELERRDQLLRNYTQNIDSLEHLCPITRLIQCHGSFSTATCRHCHSKVQSDEIKEEILNQKIPHCSKCSKDISDAILKPDIVFFGEDLSEDFHETISLDKDKCDLLIVMGSSLKVKPVSLVSELLPEHVPQILINREHLRHKTFDIELLGNCDLIINELCHRLSKIDPSFNQIKRFNQSHLPLQEVPYENLRKDKTKKPAKRPRLSSNPKEIISTSEPTGNTSPSLAAQSAKEETANSVSSASSSSSTPPRRRSFSSLITSSAFDPDSSYISYPPRRYVFAGAEIDFSSDDDDSTENDNDDELPRKHLE